MGPDPSNMIRSRGFQARSLPNLRLLELGCGKNVKPEFISLDWSWRPGVNLCWDIRKPIPLEDGSLDGIFSEHCLEHVTFENAAKVLRDCHRMLRPGGTIRILVPDGGLYLNLYQRAKAGESVEFPYVDDVGPRDLLEDSRFGFTPMMAVNRIFRGYEHLFAYDGETMGRLLLQAGFRDIEQTSFRVGRFAPLLVDSDVSAAQTLYMEAIK
jgi:predicted SAM-dependent methyltransferase